MAFDEDVPLAANQIAADLVSLNANMEFIISGDGTAGRVLRYSRLDVAYSATADSIQCYLADQWNGDDIDSSGSPHTITKRIYIVTVPLVCKITLNRIGCG